MNFKCYHRYPAGHFCRRWAEDSKRFCAAHAHLHPAPSEGQKPDISHPLSNLWEPPDLFDVVREAINATRLGHITPGQAYAIGYLADVWMRVHRKVSTWRGDRSLYRQMLTGVLVDQADPLVEDQPASSPAVGGPSPQPPEDVPSASVPALPSAAHVTPFPLPIPPPPDPPGADLPSDDSPQVDVTNVLFNLIKAGAESRQRSRKGPAYGGRSHGPAPNGRD